jgi:hypothetical protein
LEFVRETGERDPLSQTAARLASVLRMQGRSGEAASFAVLSAQAAPSEGVAAQALSRAAMARTSSEAGDHGEAEGLVREAVGVVPHEMLSLRADLLVELAEVLRAGDQEQRAMEAAKEAERLYERKGNTVSAERLTRASR